MGEQKLDVFYKQKKKADATYHMSHQAVIFFNLKYKIK